MIPAQVTRTSRRPVSIAAATAASMSARNVTSQRIARPPIRSAVAPAAASSKSATTTWAPSAASRLAAAAPMPFAPPVTSAVFPSKRLNGSSARRVGNAHGLVPALALDDGEDDALLAAGTSSTNWTVNVALTREPDGTGAGKRTLLRPY